MDKIIEPSCCSIGDCHHSQLISLYIHGCTRTTLRLCQVWHYHSLCDKEYPFALCRRFEWAGFIHCALCLLKIWQEPSTFCFVFLPCGILVSHITIKPSFGVSPGMVKTCTLPDIQHCYPYHSTNLSWPCNSSCIVSGAMYMKQYLHILDNFCKSPIPWFSGSVTWPLLLLPAYSREWTGSG